MNEPQDLNEPGLRDRAISAALGKSPFDLLIHDGMVADVATGEIRRADVGIVGALTASVHPRGAREDGKSTLDAAGLIIAPGLIDSHVHVESSMVVPCVYASTVLQRGTTTLVWDPHEFTNLAGRPGVEYALYEAAACDLRFLVRAPPCVPSAPLRIRHRSPRSHSSRAEYLGDGQKRVRLCNNTRRGTCAVPVREGVINMIRMGTHLPRPAGGGLGSRNVCTTCPSGRMQAIHNFSTLSVQSGTNCPNPNWINPRNYFLGNSKRAY